MALFAICGTRANNSQLRLNPNSSLFFVIFSCYSSLFSAKLAYFSSLFL